MIARIPETTVESGGPSIRQPPKRGRWNPRLAIVAWLLYLVALFLPSYDGIRGYSCAIAHGFFWEDALLLGDWLAVLYILLTYSNILMLASPFLLMRLHFADDDRPLIRLRWATELGVLLPCAFLGAVSVTEGLDDPWSGKLFWIHPPASHLFGELLVTQGLENLEIGAFVWAASFIVLHLATRVSPDRTATP